MPAKRLPSVWADQLAAELRRLREFAGMTGDQVAGRLDWSAAKVSRIETGRTMVSFGDLLRLLDLYQVQEARRDQLMELARSAERRGWWERYAESVREGYSEMIALEAVATAERQYVPSLIPGLLQIKAYMEEIVRSSLLTEPPGEVPRRVEVRLVRQAALTRDENPLELTVVLDEAVLRRQVGGPEVMREQLLHLAEMTAQPNVILHVLPFAKGSHPGMQGGFTILRFPGLIESGVVYLENMTSDGFVKHEKEVHHYNLAFDRLREMALDPQRSIILINQIASEFGSITGDADQ